VLTAYMDPSRLQGKTRTIWRRKKVAVIYLASGWAFERPGPQWKIRAPRLEHPIGLGGLTVEQVWKVLV